MLNLEQIYIRGQTYNSTAYYIIDQINKGNLDAAKHEYAHDGDKIPAWSKWGRLFLLELESLIGCRLHGVIGCDWFEQD